MQSLASNGYISPISPRYLPYISPISPACLALQVVQSLASNGSNIGTLQSGEVAARLKGLRQHMSDDVAVGRAVDAILRSISTISTLLELQGKQRLLRFGEVAP